MNKRVKSNSIRIIAGTWRGRRLPVLDSLGLRPTTDRVRETLFNWLMHDVAGAHCLDVFAGSGALGIECLSRGAQFVQFIESQSAVAGHLQHHLDLLLHDKARASILRKSALEVLQHRSAKAFDLVFLDPPFESDLLAQVLPLLETNGWLSESALVYLEQDSNQPSAQVPVSWTLYREGKAGQSAYRLYSVT